MSGPVLFLNVLLTVVSDAAYASLVGCLFARQWLAFALGANAPALLRPISSVSVIALLLAHLIHPWFLGASMSGSNGVAENLRLIPDIVSSTHQGVLWLIESAALAVLLIVNLFGPRLDRLTPWLSSASLVVAAGAKAASGHASNGGDFTLAEFSMLVHLLAIAVWAGAIIASGLVVIPWLARFSDGAAFWTYGNFLSRTVTWALVAIVCSGIYTSSESVNGAWRELWRSGWGRVLLVKLLFVSLALTLGALTRFKCLGCTGTDERRTLMVKLVRTEAIVMLLVLCLSGVLANTPPPMTATTSCLIQCGERGSLVV